MNFIKRILAVIEQWRWTIICLLLAICFMQQHSISALQNELKFIKEKYENPTPLSPAIPEDVPTTYSAPADEPTPDNSTDAATLIAIVAAIGTIVGWSYYKSKWPFTAALSGKIWQDLSGKVIYTLTIKNRGREPIALSNATIEFINFKEKRTFKMAVPDFPLTLTKGTKHSANISLQRLMEQHLELINYKMIRVGVECNGKVRYTLPLAVKWKNR